MRRFSVSFLAAVTTALIASACSGGSYQGITGIVFPGAQSDRGIGVNTNPLSPYYGYFYGTDSGSTYSGGPPATAEQAVRIFAPDPVQDGTSASSYVDTGNKLSYPANPPGAVLMNVFIGPDDTVWVVDYGTKQILSGPPGGSSDGGNLSVEFTVSQNPRSVVVDGPANQSGTRAFIACFGTQANCEVWKFDGASWNLEQSLGNLGLTRPFGVTVDSDGNSYWMSSSSTAPFVKKVKPDLTEDAGWTLTKPAWLTTTTWTPGGIAWQADPADAVNPEYLYIGGFNPTSVMRFDMNGDYLDAIGNLYSTGGAFNPPAGTWTSASFSGPGGNNTVWVTADDARNAYLLMRFEALVPQAYKVHLQGVPAAPSGLEASNDVYGQIRLKWMPPPAGPDSPSGYNIYRGVSQTEMSLYATSDSYPKWKDAPQATAAGGPFYYHVTAFNGAGQSAPTATVGPISTSDSSAPPPGSLGVALSYSELSAADTTNNPGYDTSWASAKQFLDDRSVAYTVVYDAQGPDDSALAIEDDDIAGFKLLILSLNRNMSAYGVQCVKDYVNYSQGRVLSSYYNSIANHLGVRQADYQLAEVYRVHALNVGSGGTAFDSDAAGDRYSFLKAAVGASEASALFAGLSGGADPFVGAQQWNSITYLISAYGDGTASEAGKWYNQDALTQSRPDPEDVGLVVGYRDASRTALQSVFTGSNWWGQSTGSTSAGYGPGTLSADRLLENILGFLGVSFSPSTLSEMIGEVKQKEDGRGAVLQGKVVSRTGMPGLPPPVFIEEPDRSSGVRLSGVPISVSEGDLITLTGQVQSLPSGERQITVFEMLAAGQGAVPAPLWMTGASVGGGTQGSQTGVDGGIGLNNIGLLVRIVGQITEISSDLEGLFFRIDDGSGVMIGSQAVPGIKVRGIAIGNIGDTAAATGVVGLELNGVAAAPILLMRDGELADLLAP